MLINVNTIATNKNLVIKFKLVNKINKRIKKPNIGTIGIKPLKPPLNEADETK